MAGAFVPKTTTKTVLAAGTALPFTTTRTTASSCLVQASPGNTGNVFIGDSTVDSSNGIVLTPGSFLEITGPEIRGNENSTDLNKWYVDAATANDSIRIVYFINEN